MVKETTMTTTCGNSASAAIERWWRNLETFGLYVTSASEASCKDRDEWGSTFVVADPLEASQEGEILEEAQKGGERVIKVVRTDHGCLIVEEEEAVGNVSSNRRNGRLLRRKGRVCLSGEALARQGVVCIVGSYKRGKLNGHCKVTLAHSRTTLDANMKDGRLHGITLGHNDDGAFSMMGIFVDGRARGPFWQKLEGGGFLYGRLDERGAFSGEDNAFIYPDLRTALRGRFVGGDMVAARACQVIGAREQDHVLHLEFSVVEDRECGLFAYAPSTLTEIRCPRTRGDPLEATTVLVGPSTMGEEGSAGEGLFAARDLDAGETVAYYNGIRVKPGQTPAFRSIHYEIYVDWCHLRGDKVKSDYMDLPSGYEDTAYYRASLGHKINHSFRPNCKWSVSQHPVFGRVPAVVTIRSVPRDSELTCHYMIDMQAAADNANMAWYLREWEKTGNVGTSEDRNEEEKEDVEANDSEPDQAKLGSSFHSEGQAIARSIIYAVVMSIGC